MAQLETTASGIDLNEIRFGVIDTDCHVGQMNAYTAGRLAEYLPQKWVDYMAMIGYRMHMVGGERPRQRQFAHRTDTVPEGGLTPGSDPDLAREQVLDAYDMSGSIMSDIPVNTGGKQWPEEMASAFSRASNEYRRDVWLASDPRWYAAITVAHENPESAVEEIRRCKENDGEFSKRWVSVMLPPDNERPAGNPKYWPIFEACEHYDIPVSFHVLAVRHTSPISHTSYYFEEHIDFALYNFPLVSSLIFEGVFERFPKLKVGLIELAWSWAPAFAWRMDSAYRKLHKEVPHLQKLPSEYFREHFWMSTQPMEEPDNPEWIEDVYATFEQAMGDKLMYSSDYPHWDFDAPDALWETLPLERRQKVLGLNASKLYNIPLLEGHGVTLEEAGARVY